MSTFTRSLTTLLLAVALLSSCVTRKRYDDLTAEKTQLESGLEACETRLAQLEEEMQQRNRAYSSLQENNRRLAEDSARLNQSYVKQKTLYDELNNTYEELIRNHNRLLSNSTAEANKLSGTLAEREQALIATEQRLQESRREIDELSNNLKAREERVKELEKVLADKEAAVNDLRTRVSNALLNFTEKDLTVDIRNGKVYVSLSEQLLFKSGSYAVDRKGVDALKKLAPILREQSDVSIMVEGHTDDVPIKTQCIADNWDLSALRATSIVRLLNEDGVDGARLIAAGRGEFVPIAEGKTATARQQNRRTEIILTPKLDELLQILEN
ncbi:chemotaxis protein MotB [Catalinimonas alkaloidigena]|uniref:Chemotaxis protein MotB n=1 Tax=Catalinimonas alkaloidigena TaxID=1075417 RepID=A0A1G9MVU2_9BACT|nr:OmpA family protein [Catalinimonas alkaloidigena]SDL78392.1 chemotaxis protein MotB [Catalinimonas alkaloidigena]